MVKATKEREARKLFVKFTGKKFPDTVEEIKVKAKKFLAFEPFFWFEFQLKLYFSTRA